RLEQIRMIAPDVGGGFGPKAPFYAEEAVIPAVALRLGRPVKWFEDRREHFLAATQERDQHYDVAVAVDRDGKILGVRGTLLHDTGAFMPWGIIMPYIAAESIPGPHVVPAHPLPWPTAVPQQRRPPTRRAPAGGGARDGAPDGPHRPRARSRSRGGAPAQSHPAGADALSGGADFPRRHAARLSWRRFPPQPGGGAGALGLRDVSRAPGE